MNTDLTALAERLRAATGPDRELDYTILSALFPREAYETGTLNTPPLTASVDASLGLVERVLPGRVPDILHDALEAMAGNGPFQFRWPGTATTALTMREVLPLAILLALVTALIAKGSDDE